MFDPEGTVCKHCAYENGLKNSQTFELTSSLPQFPHCDSLYLYDSVSKSWKVYNYKALKQIYYEQYVGNKKFIRLLAHCMYLLNQNDCRKIRSQFVNRKSVVSDEGHVVTTSVLRLENINTGLIILEDITTKNEGRGLFNFWSEAFNHIEFFNSGYIKDEEKKVGDANRYEENCPMEHFEHKCTYWKHWKILYQINKNNPPIVRVPSEPKGNSEHYNDLIETILNKRSKDILQKIGLPHYESVLIQIQRYKENPSAKKSPHLEHAQYDRLAIHRDTQKFNDRGFNALTVGHAAKIQFCFRHGEPVVEITKKKNSLLIVPPGSVMACMFGHKLPAAAKSSLSILGRSKSSPEIFNKYHNNRC